MGDIYTGCASCSSTCVNTQFCLDDSSNLKLPKSLHIKVIANPDFWGFGTLESNVMVSGWASFANGHYDFFDGYQPDYTTDKACAGGTTFGVNDEVRPDVDFRSVYDPENGHKHYNGTTEDGIDRGGAEMYLIDRVNQGLTDKFSCVENDPNDVFKRNPDAWGLAPKILTQGGVFKNITGAWRLNGCSSCYDTIVTNDLRFSPCVTGCPDTGNLDCNQTITAGAKQHILFDSHFGEKYDPAQTRCLADGFTLETQCIPDGGMPIEYSGSITGIHRDIGVSPFLTANFTYKGTAASGLRNGQTLSFANTSGATYDGTYTIFDVTHGASSTDVKLVGTVGTGNLDFNPVSGSWLAYGTFDPQSCCGGAAYGIEDSTKCRTNQVVYHVDIGRVFNNPKNKLFSNRGKIPSTAGIPRTDHRYITVNSDGYAIMIHSGMLENPGDILCSTGVWSPTATGIWVSGNTQSIYPIAGINPTVPQSTGLFPFKGKELSYFGPYYEVSGCDKALRFTHDGNTEKNTNATCYTKQAELSLFPDCLTQSTLYSICGGANTHYQNLVPRLSLVYRPCNFNDPCSFDPSGRPWTAGASGHPSTLADLKSGFGGQEIFMYINLGDARGKEILRDPCDCQGGTPGTDPPEFVIIKSPVTFPCFPKFDLDPTGYGCTDPQWYQYAKNQLGVIDSETFSPCTDTGVYPACYVKQPYTTYGYIRNLCGYEGHSRRSVINSLATSNHAGTYIDTDHANRTVEPMYVEFDTPIPSTGNWPVGGGAGCTTPPATGGLVFISGGFVYEEGCSIFGAFPYWGLSDDEGRLAYPYFYTKGDVTTPKCGGGDAYVDFDYQAWFASGFPTDQVPFLVEIDHEDYCLGCAATQIPVGDKTLTISSLDTSYLHGFKHPNDNTPGDMYGFNHCRYGTPEYAVIPDWNTSSDSWSAVIGGVTGTVTDPQDLATYAHIYTGETCSCADSTHTMRATVLNGTNVPYEWSTVGSYGNGYVPLGTCGSTYDEGSIWHSESYYGATRLLPGFKVYFKAKMSCFPSTSMRSYDSYLQSTLGLDPIFQCGNCSHSYPATNSKPDLTFDFWVVNKQHTSIFESLPDYILDQTPEWLNGTMTWNFNDVCGSKTGTISIDSPCVGAQVIIYGCKVGGQWVAWGSAPPSGSTYDCIPVNACGDVDPGTPLPPFGICECEGVSDIIATANYIDDPCNPGSLTWVFTTSAYASGQYPGDPGTPRMGGWEATGFSFGSIPKVIGAGTYGGWIAYHEDQLTSFGGVSNLVSCNPVTTVSECSYHTGPNALDDIGARFSIPARDVFNTTIGGLLPDVCDGSDSPGSPTYGTCSTPVPFGTYGGGFQTVSVRKRACHPEIMTVHKVECIASGQFKLHVSREYYEHDRVWMERYGSEGTDFVANLGFIDGGGIVYKTDTGGACLVLDGPWNPASNHPVPTGLNDTEPYYIAIPYVTPTDTVTPCHPDVCATGTNVFLCSRTHTYPSTAAYGVRNLNLDTVDGSGNNVYPDITGCLWHYYNLFYDYNSPSSDYLTDAGFPGSRTVPDPELTCNEIFPFDAVIPGTNGNTNPIYATGTPLKCLHSCLQDHEACGGLFFCNKEFFPRRPYASGTKVTRFGALSICAQNGEFEGGDWYQGYNSTTLDSSNPLSKINSTGPFVDPCDTNLRANILTSVGIDDSYIIVDDLFPLLGAQHPGFVSNVNNKTCIYNTGECNYYLPEHNNHSISISVDQNFATHDDFNYYFDVSASSGSDLCLLTPFKIMVDVECCEERLGQVGDGDPTNLSWVVQGVNAFLCEGSWKAEVNECLACEQGNLLSGVELIPAMSRAFTQLSPRTCYIQETLYHPDTMEPTGCNETAFSGYAPYGANADIVMVNMSDPGDPDACLVSTRSGTEITCNPPGIQCVGSGLATTGTGFDVYDYNGNEYARSSITCRHFYKKNGKYYIPANGDATTKGDGGCTVCENNFCNVSTSLQIFIPSTGCINLWDYLPAPGNAFCDIAQENDCTTMLSDGCGCVTCANSCGCSSLFKATITE